MDTEARLMGPSALKESRFCQHIIGYRMDRGGEGCTLIRLYHSVANRLCMPRRENHNYISTPREPTAIGSYCLHNALPPQYDDPALLG